MPKPQPKEPKKNQFLTNHIGNFPIVTIPKPEHLSPAIFTIPKSGDDKKLPDFLFIGGSCCYLQDIDCIYQVVYYIFSNNLNKYFKSCSNPNQ